LQRYADYLYLHSFPTRRSSDLEPLKATSYMAVGFYVAKYVNKKSDMDLAAKGLGAKEWNNSLKTKLSLLPKKLFRIRMSRNLVLITLLNVTLIILTLSVSRLLNLLLRLVAFLLFLNPQCLASISRWITASSSWKRFCLFVCRALSSITVICMLTAIRLLLTFVMSLYLLLRS